jgi:hypothetical protein
VACVVPGRGTAADAPPVAPPKPGTIIVLGEGLPNGGRPPSLAYAWDRKAERPPLLFSRRSALVGDVHALAFAHDGRPYYLCMNRFTIVREDKDGEEAVFNHKTYVRDLALDDGDNLYFSEATGAGADGKIYRVVPATEQAPAKAELVCTVRLQDIGSWAGDFAFARTDSGALDTDTLYLSSGNQVPSSIFRMARKAGAWGKPERVFGAEMSISGLVLASPQEAYFVSGNQVFSVVGMQKMKAVLTLPDVGRLTDLSVVFGAPSEKAK